jgi:hypothetical protein
MGRSEYQMRLELRLGAERRAGRFWANSVFWLVSVAEDRGFEPLRAVNPTRFPSERHRPLGESSAGEATCLPSPPRNRRGPRGRLPIRHRETRPPRLCANPPCGGISLNPPGPEGSKGRWALPGARGASHVSARLVRVHVWSPPSPCTAATGRRRSPR